MLPTNPQSQQIVFKRVWDYCHYGIKVLDYLLVHRKQ